MSTNQVLVLAILLGAMTAFIIGRWRHDVVAFAALMLAVVIGVVPTDGAFTGFGHPAVFTVAAVLVLSRALKNSGAINIVTQRLETLGDRPATQRWALTGLAAAMSAFMNNVGALALMMPVAMELSARSNRPPSQVLMPLAFGSILGGLMTLIGTPPNIIVAKYRAGVASDGEPFSMFDFTPIGLTIALIGLCYINLVGWRLLPKARPGGAGSGEKFAVSDYITELRVTDQSRLIGERLGGLASEGERELEILGLVRNEIPIFHSLSWQPLKVDDVIILRADSTVFQELVADGSLELVGDKEIREKHLQSEDVGLVEAVVPPGALIENRTPKSLRFHTRFGVNILAIARSGRPFRDRLDHVRISAGDVLLLQGDIDATAETAVRFGCLPLRPRGLEAGRQRKLGPPLLIFIAALLLCTSRLVPVPVAFGLAVVGVVLVGSVTPRELYESIDWSVIVLLAAMIPLGSALESTGCTALIATGLLSIGDAVSPVVLLGILLVVTMTLSDFMNNAATAVIMAPLAAGIATELNVDPDPYLMAVAIGASCAFLTPIGHQNNVLVMGPGGYRFSDYWRMGLWLELLIVAVALTMLSNW